MTLPFDRSLKIGYCGLTKIGKSHLAARFIKDFDGVFLDFAGVQQYKASTSDTPTYSVSSLARGEAWPACQNAGIDPSQYCFVRSWEDLEASIELARSYRDAGSTKENGRVWLVFDDTHMWRWHEAIHQSKVNRHRSIVKDDWGQATSQMTLRIRQLEAEFNLLFVNQMGDEWLGGESTGNKVGRFYPSNIEYSYDIVGELYINRTQKPYNQRLRITANRVYWVCADDFVEEIENPTPTKILESCRVDPSLW